MTKVFVSFPTKVSPVIFLLVVFLPRAIFGNLSHNGRVGPLLLIHCEEKRTNGHPIEMNREERWTAVDKERERERMGEQEVFTCEKMTEGCVRERERERERERGERERVGVRVCERERVRVCALYNSV